MCVPKIPSLLITISPKHPFVLHLLHLDPVSVSKSKIGTPLHSTIHVGYVFAPRRNSTTCTSYIAKKEKFKDYFIVADTHMTPHTITASIAMRGEGAVWSLTTVYGPQSVSKKLLFIEELKLLQPVVKPEWVLLGDFNLITWASDKNNSNINRRLFGKFRGALDFLHLQEINLGGRRFTWSNEQENPVLTKIDHVFCSDDWDMMFPNALLLAVPTLCSDHAPLFLQGAPPRTRKISFKFEEFWLQAPGFHETVAHAWNKPVFSTDALRRIHIKLSRAAKALKKWQKEKFGNLDCQLAIIKEVMWCLDLTEEDRPLSAEERDLRRHLKSCYLGHLTVQKIKMRQRSRLIWIKTADANTKLFHIRVNDRRRRNYIQQLQTQAGLAITRADKEKELLEHFHGHLGVAAAGTRAIDWAAFGGQARDLSHLDADFTETEIKEAMFSISSVTAPGPDGFIGAFFKSC